MAPWGEGAITIISWGGIHGRRLRRRILFSIVLSGPLRVCGLCVFVRGEAGGLGDPAKVRAVEPHGPWRVTSRKPPAQATHQTQRRLPREQPRLNRPETNLPALFERAGV